jgi:hypothetical protein
VLEVRLSLQPLRESVQVNGDNAGGVEAGPVFSTLLTQKQINSLPDDPEEMKKMLERMAGQGGVIRVDGFAAQRLPPKSQIASIRIRLSPYAAEDHDLGFSSIDIRTKPGTGAWHGTAAFDYSGAELDARNFFAPEKGLAQYRHLREDLSGPLREGRSSVALWLGRGFSYDSQATTGILPTGPFTDLVRVPVDGEAEGGRLLHFLTKNQVVLVQFEHVAASRGLLGQFDLPDRLVRSEQEGNELRFMHAATPSPQTLNEARLQVVWSAQRNLAVSGAPATIVNGAFGEGGGGANKRTARATVTLTDDFHQTWRGHGFSAGTTMDYERSHDHDLTNDNGTFVFPSLAAFLSTQPAQYSRLLGDATVRWEQWQFGGYIQDEFRPRENVALSLGGRWEGQTHVARRSNFAPRLGLAWTPLKKARLTLRGGFGVFYAWLPADVYGETLRFNGVNQNTLLILNPGYPDPAAGGYPAR